MAIEPKELVPLILAIAIGYMSFAQSWKKQEARGFMIAGTAIPALILIYLDDMLLRVGTLTFWGLSYQLLAIFCGFGLATLYSWLTSNPVASRIETPNKPEGHAHPQTAAGND